MTDATTLRALAERVEAATAPTFALDDDIAQAVNVEYRPRAYTASLDAAASLVPGGWSWSAWGADSFTGTRPGAVLADETYKAPEIPWDCDRPIVESRAATPALALCAAALKARAAMMEDGK